MEYSLVKGSVAASRQFPSDIMRGPGSGIGGMVAQYGTHGYTKIAMYSPMQRTKT